MQAPSINLWSIPVGVAAALGVIGVILFWQRRQRRLRRERPPISKNLLRPPGHTLSIQLQDCQDRLVKYLAITAGAGAALSLFLTILAPILFNKEVRAWIAANGLQHSLFSRQLLPGVLLVAGCLCGLVYGVARCLASIKQMRSFYLGLRGEQAVAEALLETAQQGYRSFHDFPADKNWNIDHVVVGPGGVFAIETKTRSKRKAPPGQRDQEVLYDGKVLAFPWCRDTKAVTQAEANARGLAKYLRKSTGIDSVWVTGLLVIPGWYVSCTNRPLDHAVRAMPDTALAKHLQGLPRVLSDQQIQQIAFQVEQKCRDVEF